MAPEKEKSSLKRGRASTDHDSQDLKKPRRSQSASSQVQSQITPVNNDYLPTPLTHEEKTTTTNSKNELTATPPDSPSQARHQVSSNSDAFHSCSSPGDTQAFSQFIYPPRAFADGVNDEATEGVWGYLIPLNDKVRESLVLRKRGDCSDIRGGSPKAKPEKRVWRQVQGHLPGGYLVGRHLECDMVIDIPTISNRHFLIFSENRKGGVVAVLEDLSSNGTFINDALVGRNKHRELDDGDEVSILDQMRFVFRYPRTRDSNGFHHQYRILEQLGKGHFATVYLCVERATGSQYAAKVFERRSGDSQMSNAETLQQEIALLMGVNHPNLLCLKEAFDENDGVYLVTELAPEGELFNLIVSKTKLSESETRCVFVQLFDGLKYLHDRGIVHRDIKPENILLIDKKLRVKLGDFGLAKIIGEDSFTTTLCGTPSYVAPEILQETRRRKYTKAVDVWSLGVVLYICLCGFPPFSDELYTAENPYTLAQQIKLGRFDYPSPYWDSVGDPALDLIDRMLTVDVNKRITVDECLRHPWLTGNYTSISDSTDSLTGALGQLGFSRRKVQRERTLLSSINNIRFSERQEGSSTPVKVFHQNHAGKRVHSPGKVPQQREASPVRDQDPEDFVNLGVRGDPVLFEEQGTGFRKND